MTAGRQLRQAALLRTIATTVKKELMSYFFSPVAYVIAVLFYLFRGLEVQALAWRGAQSAADADLFPTFYLTLLQSTFFIIVLVPPILTMRAFAEERRSGSLEVLLTAPVRNVEIVIGKWLAACIFFGILWLPTLPLLWVMTWPPFLGIHLSFGPVLTGYLGLCLLGAMLLAVGCFTSSLTDNQLLASLAALLFDIALLVNTSVLQPLLGSAAQEPGPVRTWLEQFNVMDHMGGWFGRGIVDSGQVAFYLLGTAFFLFLTVKSLEMRKWA